MSQKYDLIVVGGGVAGLYSIYKYLLSIDKINKNKISGKEKIIPKILLLESSDRLGGRLHTIKNKNQVYVAGGARFSENHKLLFELIRTFKLEKQLYPLTAKKVHISKNNPGVELDMDVTNKNKVLKSLQNNDVDFTYKATFAPDKAPYTIGLIYTQNDTNGSKPSATRTVGKYYQEINGSYNFGFATAAVAYGENKNDVEVKSLKLTKSIFNADATLTYIDADRKDTLGNSNLNKNREYITLGVSKIF